MSLLGRAGRLVLLGVGVVLALLGLFIAIVAPAAGLVLLVVGVIITPPARRLITTRTGVDLGTGLTAGIVVVLLVAFVFALPPATDPTVTESDVAADVRADADTVTATPAQATPEPTPTPTPAQVTPEPTPAAERGGSVTDLPSNGVYVRVLADGAWAGSVGTSSGARSVEGYGQTLVEVDANTGLFSNDVVSVAIQNRGSGTLTVQLIRNGEVVTEQSSSAQYGVVTFAENV